METTVNVQTVHTGTIHIVTAFPGGHSNTALCGTLLAGKIRLVVRPSNCPDCCKAAR